MKTAVFSILSPNYRHFARVLMHSLQRHHEEWDRFILLAGDPPEDESEEEPFSTVRLSALSLPNEAQFCFRYTVVELNTAVKPWMFEYLFARGYDRVLYFDPDIVVYSRLGELDALPPETFLVVTPHLTIPIQDAAHPIELSVLQAGTYNLGFLSLCRKPPLPSFLSWWRTRLEFQCVAEISRGLFVDQKWIDLVPGLFPGVSILRHDGYNVAYWNLRQRTVVAGDPPEVNGQPLRFFHFSGFDPAQPEIVSKHDSSLKIAEVGDAGKLVEAYRAALEAAGSARFRRHPYPFGFFSDGTAVPALARVIYRNSPELQRACGSDPFERPDLFRGIHDPKPSRSSAMSRFLRAWLLRFLPRRFRSALRELVLPRRPGSSH